MNPKSAVERTKNHLAYKLGQEMLKSKRAGGGGLLFRLLKIKAQHQKESKFYQQQILQSPQQKYPKLETLNDYPQSLSVKNSLSYRLGEELINA